MIREELIAALEKAEAPDRDFDSAIVALNNNSLCRPYPPSDDFGPKNRWQFWSLDGRHFLGSETKFKVPYYTSSIDAALTLTGGVAWHLEYSDDDNEFRASLFDGHDWKHGISWKSAAIAICIAALKARSGT